VRWSVIAVSCSYRMFCPRDTGRLAGVTASRQL
jgi:hypothetical protein